MRTPFVRLGFAALRARIPPPPLRGLARYREYWDFKKLLERLGITLFLDVGANDGTFAQGIRDMGYSGRIVSFEPNPTEFKNTEALASGDPNWTAEWCALGSEAGTAPLNVTDSNSVFSSLLTPTKAPPVSRVVEVPVHRLDEIWNRLVTDRDRVFLKTDTQGFDLKVLQGLGARLNDVCGIQIELNVVKLYENSPHYLNVLEFLESSGFSVLELRPNHYTKQGFIIEFDCFAARASAFLSATTF
jgi:FkbM family methyltransferase